VRARPTNPADLHRSPVEIRNRPGPTNLGTFPRPRAGGLEGAITRAGDANTAGIFDPSRPGEIRLPEPAAAKLRALRNTADDIDTARRALTDRRTALISQREDALQRLRQLGSSPEARLYATADNPAFREPAQRRDAAVAEIAELDARIADLRARTPQVLRAVNAYVAGLRGDTLIEAHPPVTPEPGQTAESVGRQLADLGAELGRVRGALMRSTSAKALWRADIAAHAERCDPNVLHTLEGAPVQWPTVLVRGELHGHVAMEGAPMVVGFVQVRVPDTMAILSMLAGEALMERIAERIDEVADDANALDDDERAEAEARLLGQILEMERTLAAIVEASGSTEYPKDMDPRAVLGIVGPPPRE